MRSPVLPGHISCVISGLGLCRGTVVHDLIQKYGEEITLQVELSELQDITGKPASPNIKSAVMTYKRVGEYAFEDRNLQVFGLSKTRGLRTPSPYSSGIITGKITIIASINEQSTAVPDGMCITRKILEQELSSDLIIISKGGNRINCHKAFLVAHSPAFEGMFRAGMQEAQTNTIELLDMNEKAVKAMLAYLYCWDLSAAQESSEVAFDLLCAGQKYLIPTLVAAMRKILLQKENAWYNVDVALSLFVFANNLQDNQAGAPLKVKAAQVLKS